MKVVSVKAVLGREMGKMKKIWIRKKRKVNSQVGFTLIFVLGMMTEEMQTLLQKKLFIWQEGAEIFAIFSKNYY